MNIPLIPLTVLLGNPERIGPTLSPDGRRIAWIAPHEGVLNVWVGDRNDPIGTGRVVTADRDRGVQTCQWTPDGDQILFRRDTGGDEQWRLYAVDPATRQERCLAGFDGAQVLIAAVDKRHPEHILVAINKDQPHAHDMYRLNLATGDLVKIFDNPGFAGMVADADFRIRAAAAMTPDGRMAVLVRDTEDTPWRPLLIAEVEDALSTMPILFNIDGSRLLCLTSIGANATRAVWIDVATGAQELVYGDDTYDVVDIAVHIDTREPMVAYVQREQLDHVPLDPSIADDLATLADLDAGDLRLVSTDHTNTVWLAAFTADDGPVDYFTFDRATGESTFLFSHQPALNRYTLASMRPFKARTRDDKTLHGYVTVPPDPDPDPGSDRGPDPVNLPTVVLVHGGPWVRDIWGFHPVAQWLANRGYLVVQPNFRGSSGYGKEWLNLGNRQWGAAMHDDVLDAVAHVVDQGWADPTRIGIFGGSYGGYAALIGASFTPDVFACAVSLCGPMNLSTLIENMPPEWTPIKSQILTRIGDPATEPDFLWSRSPLSRADKIRRPVLVGQGANDRRVPQSQADQLVKALDTNGVPYTYLEYGDEGHGLVKPDNRLRFYTEVEQFLAVYLGGRFEPDAITDTRATEPKATNTRAVADGSVDEEPDTA